MTKKRLGSHDDKRLPEGQGSLPSENMEIVCRVGADSHDHVDVYQLLDSKLFLFRWKVLRIITKYFKFTASLSNTTTLSSLCIPGHLQESLRPGRAVLWPHPLHPMGQQHDQPTLPDPLALPAGNKLVNDTLGSVGKVSKLSLPQHQGIGVCHGVAKLKPKDTVLRQGAVTD